MSSFFLLITGAPGCGKTTIVQKLVSNLRTSSKVPNFYGFFTEEIRNSNRERIGFDVVTLDGKRGPLARTSTDVSRDNRPASGMTFKVGKYIVYVREFEDLCMNLIESANENSLLVIDEIGKMELLSENFEVFIKQLIKSPKNLKIIATVPLKSPAVLIDQLKNSQKSHLLHVTKTNRDEIYNQVLHDVQQLIS